MQTYFYGRLSIGGTSLDMRNLTINFASDYRPLGTELIPDGTERNGGAFYDHTKGDPIGLEVWCWSTNGVPTEDDVSLFQLDSLDRTPDPRCRKIATVQLLRDWWRRSETADGGKTMRWGFRVLAYDQPDLLLLVQLGDHHTLSFHPTAFEAPVQEGRKVTRKNTKGGAEQSADQPPLPFGQDREWPGADPELQQTRRELATADEQLLADCRVVAAAMDITGFQSEEELAVKSLGGGLTPEELERVSVAIAWLVDAGFARAEDLDDAAQYTMTLAGRAWLKAKCAEPAPVESPDAPAELPPEPLGSLFSEAAGGGQVDSELLADWLAVLLRVEGQNGVSFGALRQMTSKHSDGAECVERDIRRAAAKLEARGLLSPKGKAGKLWTVNL